jgi:hypothetical protein
MALIGRNAGIPWTHFTTAMVVALTEILRDFDANRKWISQRKAVIASRYRWSAMHVDGVCRKRLHYCAFQPVLRDIL